MTYLSLFKKSVSVITLMALLVLTLMPPSGYANVTCVDLGPADEMGFTCQDREDGIDVTTLRDVNINLSNFNTAANSKNIFNLSLGNFTANVGGINPTLIGGNFEINNGILSIFNANGVHIMSTADFKFDNGSLLAAAGRMDNVSGKIDATGFVLNEGSFHGTGDVAFVGQAIENKGTIDLPMNRVLLGAGNVVTIGLSGDNLVSVVVDEENIVTEDVMNFEGVAVKDQIKNSGNIKASQITLNAQGVDSVFTKAINLSGETQAQEVRVSADGLIEFIARGDIHSDATLKADKITMNTDGKILNSGTIEATEFHEHGYTFKSTGTLAALQVFMDNTDGAADLSGNVGSLLGDIVISDTGDINLVGNVTLIGNVTLAADSDANGVGRISFSVGVSLLGGNHDLTLKSSQQSIIRGMDDLRDLTLIAQTVGARFTLNDAIDMNGDLTVNAGATLDGGYSVTVRGGSVTGAGDINMTGGTFTILGTGNFGGAQDWNFQNLTFGDGVAEATTTKVAANKITIAERLHIKTNQRLEAGSGVWDLTWGGGFLTDIIQIAAGYHHTLALKSNGTVYSWGTNEYGQLGNNSTDDEFFPVQVLGVGGVGFLEGIIYIAAGLTHSLAVKGDDVATVGIDESRVFAWGQNSNGELGNGTNTGNAVSNNGAALPVWTVPVAVLAVSGQGEYLQGVSKVAAGNETSYALKSDGSRVYSWGMGIFGSLGNGGYASSNRPVEVKSADGNGFLSGISDIAAGGWSAMALKADDGKVYVWGDNFLSPGQLGIGAELTEALLPTFVKGVGGIGELSGVIKIAMGFAHSLALKADGTVYAWGDNSFSAIGSSSEDWAVYTPVQMKGVNGVGFLGGITDISAGLHNSAAVSSGGTVYTWGVNFSGGLGVDSEEFTIDNPVIVSALSGVNIDRVSAGYEHMVALAADGSFVYAWGSGESGELGVGREADSYVPVTVSTGPGVNRLIYFPFLNEGDFDAQTSTFLYSGEYAFGDLIVPAGIPDNTIFYNLTLRLQAEDYIFRGEQASIPNLDKIVTGNLVIGGEARRAPPIDTKSLDKVKHEERQKQINAAFGLDDHGSSIETFQSFLRAMKEFKQSILSKGVNNFEVDPSAMGFDQGMTDFKQAVFQAQAKPLTQRPTLNAGAPTGTRIENVQGNVRVVAQDGSIYQAEAGTELNEGDQVVTDTDAKVELKKGEDTVTVAEGSAVQIAKQTQEAGKPVQDLLTLAFGKMSAEVSSASDQSSFVVQTPNGMSGVRG